MLNYIPLTNPNVYENLTFDEKVSLHIYMLRERLGVSRKELSAKINITTQVLAAIEQFWYSKERRSSIAIDEIAAIAQGLGVDVSYLMPK